MPEDASSSGNIPVIAKEYIEDESIILETAQQIIKDFRLYEMEILFEGKTETPYQILFDQIKPWISDMVSTNLPGLFSLLYTIDVPDHWWKNVRDESDPEIIAGVFTDIIIKRELLKVLTRMKFRQGRIE